MGRLLFVSDLEGCATESPSKQPQSQYLCSKPFFDSLDLFLQDPSNKVAFLGDYFDQGPLVVNSINYIMDIYNKYTDRVIIILGNRDLNKLRLIYELNPQEPANKTWSVWAKFYKNSAALPIDKLKNILTNSMGAKWPPMLDAELNEEQASYLLIRAFSQPAASKMPNAEANEAFFQQEKYANFIKNCRQLFTVGKIVVKDEEFKTLLSHAGGAEPFLLHTQKYYDDIRTLIQPGDNYYGKIETVREELEKEPKEINEFFDVNLYNSPLASISSMFDSTVAPPLDFFLLQGLGLKPNGDKPFTSFVQSCDIKSCKGPSDPKDPLKYREFLEKLGVQAIAHGHSPHCAPIPLIYKREDANILFIANDTSNGYRTGYETTPAPLAYITDNLEAGVAFLADEYIPQGFDPMIGEWTIDTAPTYESSTSSINYNGYMLTFPAKSGTNPFAPTVMAVKAREARETTGGKRKSHKSRKTHRKNKNKKQTKKSVRSNHLRLRPVKADNHKN